jgi:methionine-S-sulfoxide reductase
VRKNIKKNKIEIAVFGGGCFWGMEAIFERLNGVLSVVSGYSGGEIKPSFKNVFPKKIKHAEVVKIEYDSNIITYDDLLKVFFSSHDFTSINRQGSDIGPQYRSIILYTNNQQKKKAEKYINDLNELGEEKVATELKKFEFYEEADKNYQDYYKNNPNKSYCQINITPKLIKFRKKFKKYLKEKE